MTLYQNHIYPHLHVHVGGYTASCAAMSYPDIGAVVGYRSSTVIMPLSEVVYVSLPQIIDASFDELFPLVKTRITPHLRKLVAYVCITGCITTLG